MILARSGPQFSKPSSGAQVNWGHPLTRGLTARWLMSEGGGTRVLNLADANNHGTCRNSPVWTPSSRGMALAFNGADQRVAVPTTFQLAYPFTLAAWVYPISYATQRVIMSKRNTSVISDTVGSWALTLTSGAVTFYHGVTKLTFVYAPPVNQWTHLTMSADGAVDRLSVNGAFQEQIAATAALGTNTAAAMTLGALFENASMFLGGLDDLQVWNRKLSDYEINKMYAAPFTSLLAQSPRAPYFLTTTNTYFAFDDDTGDSFQIVQVFQ